ncbi:MAG: hypothetical protein ACI84C_000314 [Flavobacteriales bacterium]|jgi:hypothetical protein
MKRITLFTMFLSLGLSLFAQDEAKMLGALQDKPSIEVNETTTKFRKENRPAFTVYINAEPGKVEKAWAGYVKAKCQCDFKKKNGVYEALAIHLSEVTIETISLFSVVEEDEKGARLDVLVDLGVTYLSSKNNSDEASKMSNMVEQFVRGFYVGWYDTVLKNQRKVLDKSTKVYDGVVKDGEKLVKNISKNTEGIQKSEEAIIKAEKDIVDLQAKMDELRGAIEQSKSEIVNLEKQVQANTEMVAAEKVKVEAQRQVIESLKQNADAIKTGK